VKLCKWCCCLMLVVWSMAVVSSSAAAQPRLLLVLWHGLAWEDVEASPLYEEGIMAVGTMNVRAGSGSLVSGAYLTIASGSRAFGVENAALMLHGDEFIHGFPAHRIYSTRTGREASAEEIVNPQIAMIINAASQASYPLQVGALAECLGQSGVQLGVFGSSDLSDQRVRWAALVGMDAEGKAARGLVSTRLLIDDADYPHGKRTDYQLLAETVLNAGVDAAIVDLGDPFRLDSLTGHLLPEQHQVLRRRAASEAWGLIAQLHLTLPDAVIVIAAPFPDYHRADIGQWLAPLVIIGKGAGMLTSGTTRWPGLVSNIDVAPTAVEVFGLDKGPMLGRTVSVEPMQTGKALGLIKQLEARVFQVHRYRNQVLRWLTGIQIMLYILTLALLIIPRAVDRRFVRLVQLALLVCMSLPLMLLVLPQGWFWPLAAAAALFVLNGWARGPLVMVMIISLATAALVTADILRGSQWIRYSVLGYDPVGGARYYGLGNEYMGILIGSLIMGWAAFKDMIRDKKTWAAGDLLLFAGVSAVIAAPQWGTNVGGTVAAICGFGVAWQLAHRRMSWFGVFLIAVLVVLALAGLMLFDSSRPEALQSHIGQTKALISREGAAAVWDIVVRKLSTNLRLLRYSIWSRVLIMGIAAMGASLFWPSRFLQWLMQYHPSIVVGIAGTLSGTVSALVFNDSGVVAAATCSLYAATTMLTLALSLKHNLLPA